MKKSIRLLLIGLIGISCTILSRFHIGKSFNGFVNMVKEIKAITPEKIQAENKYCGTSAHVRVGNELCWQERVYIAQRMPQVKKSLQKMLGVSYIPYVPKINIVMSGGGLRAMLFSTGFLLGAIEAGLIDSTSYISTLSGSTWALSLLLAHPELSGDAFKELVIAKAAKGRMPASHEWKLLFKSLHEKRIFDEQLTTVDFYGALISNSFFDDFGEQRHKLRLSDQLDILHQKSFPFPIYTAIGIDKQNGYKWFEFTPYEVGSPWLSLYIPTWSYGRKFYQGTSINFAPEHALGFLLGTYGSAFGAPIDKIYREAVKDHVGVATQKFFEKVVLKWFGDKRVFNGLVRNFSYGMKESPLQFDEQLRLVDAGIDFNLPYPPISGERPERASDIIIFVDASKELGDEGYLPHVASYAQQHNLPFPEIDTHNLTTRTTAIFSDKRHKDAPLVCYISRVFDQEQWQNYRHQAAYASLRPYLDCYDTHEDMQGTTKQSYTDFEARQLIALGQANVSMALSHIKQAIYTHMYS